MEKRKIGVGIIGASQGGWAVRAHLPALKNLPDLYNVVAVSTTNQKTADATAKDFNVPFAFDNEFDLVNHPDVELVIITVKVPGHKKLVEAAVSAGKLIYSEWPLGNGTAEAEYLDRLTKEKYIKTFSGLQSGSLPEIKFLKEYISEGNLGDIYSSTIVGAGNNWGTSLPEESLVYLLDPKNGATMLHIPFAHTLHGLQLLLGSFKKMSSILTRRNHTVSIAGTNKKVPQLSNDQLVLMGELENGAVASMHYHGGESTGLNLYWEIKGSKGSLFITSPTGHLQFGKLKMQIALNDQPLTDLEIPEKYQPSAGGDPGFDAPLDRSMYYAYQDVAADINNGTEFYPNFSTAVEHHKLIDSIESANQIDKMLTSNR